MVGNGKDISNSNSKWIDNNININIYECGKD